MGHRTPSVATGPRTAAGASVHTDTAAVGANRSSGPSVAGRWTADKNPVPAHLRAHTAGQIPAAPVAAALWGHRRRTHRQTGSTGFLAPPSAAPGLKTARTRPSPSPAEAVFEVLQTVGGTSSRSSPRRPPLSSSPSQKFSFLALAARSPRIGTNPRRRLALEQLRK